MNNISPKGKDKHPGSTICGYFSLCCSFCFYALIPLNAHGLLPKSHMSSQTGFNICLTIWGIGFILALVASRASKAWLFAAILPVLNVVFVLYAMSA